jgi:hypothetical protein
LPAKDRYHDVVVRALIKAGWTITAEQIVIILAERRLWIDIQAVKASESRAILVEVKGFENRPSPVESLVEAVGKYVFIAPRWTTLRSLHRCTWQCRQRPMMEF